MKLIDKNNKFVGLTNLLENAMRDYYENKDTNKFAFSKLSHNEKKQCLSELVLTEYAELAAQVASLGVDALRKQLDKQDMSTTQIITQMGLNKSVHTSMGDVTKLPEYHHVNYIVEYSLKLNSAYPNPSHFQMAYNQAMGTVARGLEVLRNNKDLFRNALQKELHYVGENDLPNRIISLFFFSLCYELFNTANLLFGKCFQAEFDFNKRPAMVTSIKFEYDGKSHEEDLAYLEAVNDWASKGAMRDYLLKFDLNANDKEYIAKEFKNFNQIAVRNESSLRELLGTHTSKLLTENVGDVAFAFISSSKVLDLLFLPIYIIRYLIYLMKYTIVSYDLISKQIKSSVDILKKQSLTHEEYMKYKSHAEQISNEDERASTMAYSKLEDHVKEDKASILHVKQTAGASTNSILI
jgi:hypothetical protein